VDTTQSKQFKSRRYPAVQVAKSHFRVAHCVYYHLMQAFQMQANSHLPLRLRIGSPGVRPVDTEGTHHT